MGIQVIDLRKLVIVGILNGKKLNSNSIECSCLVCGYFSDPLRFKRFSSHPRVSRRARIFRQTDEHPRILVLVSPFSAKQRV